MIYNKLCRPTIKIKTAHKLIDILLIHTRGILHKRIKNTHMWLQNINIRPVEHVVFCRRHFVNIPIKSVWNTVYMLITKNSVIMQDFEVKTENKLLWLEPVQE